MQQVSELPPCITVFFKGIPHALSLLMPAFKLLQGICNQQSIEVLEGNRHEVKSAVLENPPRFFERALWTLFEVFNDPERNNGIEVFVGKIRMKDIRGEHGDRGIVFLCSGDRIGRKINAGDIIPEPAKIEDPTSGTATRFEYPPLLRQIFPEERLD